MPATATPSKQYKYTDLVQQLHTLDPPDLQAKDAQTFTKEEADFKDELNVLLKRLKDYLAPQTPAQAGTTPPATPAQAGTTPPATPAQAGTTPPATPAQAAMTPDQAKTMQEVQGLTARGDVQRLIDRVIQDVDAKVSKYLGHVYHHPKFQALEATWRGLSYLVSNTETGTLLKIKVLNASKQDLKEDLGDEAPLSYDHDQSALFKKVYEEEYGQLGGEPYGVLVGDYEFDHSPPDVYLLTNISRVAADAHAPFVAAASSRMFNMKSFADLGTPRDLSRIFDSDLFNPWNFFRSSDESRYVALTVPRVLCRPPYGLDVDHGRTPIEEFDFEEDVAGPDDSKFLWMNAAWAYAARLTEAFAIYGWLARTRGVDTGGQVDSLPFYMFQTDDGDWALRPPVQSMISDRREFELSNLGFLPLVYRKHSQSAAFLGSQSCQKPLNYFDADANSNAQLSAKFNLILCVSRFAHYLKVMARDKIGSFMEVKDCSDWLNAWIRNYIVDPRNVGETTKARFPLSSARVDVSPVAGKPGWYECVAYLRPHYQLEALTASLRLVAEVPQLAS